MVAYENSVETILAIGAFQPTQPSRPLLQQAIGAFQLTQPSRPLLRQAEWANSLTHTWHAGIGGMVGELSLNLIFQMHFPLKPLIHFLKRFEP